MSKKNTNKSKKKRKKAPRTAAGMVAGKRRLGRRKGAAIAVGSEQQLAAQLDSGQPVIIDFWAEWCGPCRAMAPAFEAAASEWQGKVRFLKVDTERAPALSDSFGIRSLPTVVAMVGDDIVDTRIGATDATTLGKMAQRALDKAEGVGLGGRFKRLFGQG